jgi:alpha-amylase
VSDPLFAQAGRTANADAMDGGPRRRNERQAMHVAKTVLWLGLCLLILLSGCSSPQATTPPKSVPETPSATPIRVEPHQSWDDAILYFVIVDRFADGDATNNQDVDRSAKGAFHGGDLAGLTNQLDELADLGVTAMWITPVVENIPGYVTGAGFPDWGYHGYWADDFYALDRRFGSEADLKALVDAAHERGIAILLDVVYNHAGYDSRYTKDPKTKGWLRTEALGTCGTDDLTSCLAGLPDFKTEKPEVREYLLEAHLGLAERVGLDGFRLDTVKHVSHDFWQQHRQAVNKRLSEDFFLLGEVWGGDAPSLDPWFEGDEMDAGFDFGFVGSSIGFLAGRGRTIAFNRYLEKRHLVREGYLLAHYLSSHDVPGALYTLEGDLETFRLLALLQFTNPGIPTIYYGEEVGRPGGDWPENRSVMPWGDRDILPGKGKPRDEALREDYKRLIAIRRAHPALWRGDHTGLSYEGDLLVFQRTDETSGDVVIVAVNRGREVATASFELPAGWAGRSVQDIWNEESMTATTGPMEIEVGAREARILIAE